MFSLDEKRYSNINDILVDNVKFYKYKKEQSLCGVSASFDIETSSFYVDSDGHTSKEQPMIEKNGKLIPDESYFKGATMYMWGIGINGRVMIGRTWGGFVDAINSIIKYYQTSVTRRFVIYVHNLAYEFQWIRKLFDWEEVFAIDERKPLYACTSSGIEFRCSYQLSGYSLEKVGEHLTKYKVNKLVGQLDYNIIRHYKTHIEESEFQYLINDNLVVMAYIQELIEELGNITRIQLTKTGFVRKDCRDACFYENKSHKIHGWKYLEFQKLIHSLKITSKEEYLQWKDAFQGGFTHANSYHVGKVLKNVSSIDFTSAYPFCLVSQYYPMTTGERVRPKSMKEFNEYLDAYCCVFDVEFDDIESTFKWEHYISSSKCYIDGYNLSENGRVVFAHKLKTTLTEIDFKIIRKTYKWKKAKYTNVRIYARGYLPKDLILATLEYYKKKTELKDVDGMEREYQNSKEKVNSIFGMMVTDIVREENVYKNGMWMTQDVDADKIIQKYNDSKNRFLFYLWGIYITAHNRMNLWSGILEFGEDYVYSDTDSIKGLHIECHQHYIDEYNKRAIYDLKQMCEYHKIDFNLCCPHTIKGVEKILGIWDFEHTYSRFKTLGSKRYMFELDGKIKYTIAGCGKVGIEYLKEKFHNNNTRIFEFFNDKTFTIPREHTGKLTHTYIDDTLNVSINDFNGVNATICELSYIHLEPCEFTLSMTKNFIEYLDGLIYDIYE